MAQLSTAICCCCLAPPVCHSPPASVSAPLSGFWADHSCVWCGALTGRDLAGRPFFLLLTSHFSQPFPNNRPSIHLHPISTPANQSRWPPLLPARRSRRRSGPRERVRGHDAAPPRPRGALILEVWASRCTTAMVFDASCHASLATPPKISCITMGFALHRRITR